MKKLIVTAVFAVAVHIAGNAQVTQPYVPPSAEQVASGYMKTRVSYWNGNYSFSGVTNNSTTNISSSFIMQLVGDRWAFTEMSIAGNELPIDSANPLWQIPPYLAGNVQNFNLWVYGYDKNRQQIRYGSFYAGTLAPNDDITVPIYLNYIQKTEAYVLAGDHNAGNTSIVSTDGRYNGYYDSSVGGFRVWYDPINPPTGWLIIDTRNNSPFDSLPFKGSKNAGTPNTGYGFVFMNQNGTPEMYLNNSNAQSVYFQGLLLDQAIPRNNTNFTGKAVVTHVSSTNDYVQVYVSGLRAGATVEAYGLAADGDTIVKVGSWTSSVSNTQFYLSDVRSYADYTFVVYGSLSDPTSGFTISVYDSTYPQSGGIGKGAVQKPTP